MPCSVGLLPYPRSAACAQPTGLLEVTVTDRCIPLVTAAYGTRVAREVRTTMLARGGDGTRATPGLGPTAVPTASRARARRARGSRGFELWPAS